MKQKIPNLMAPCGIYCGACPSFGVSCNGCGSEDRNQKRISKWGCKIRKCCLEDKKLEFCYQCKEYPCKKYFLKLRDSHINQKKYHYRHELSNNLKRLKRIGINKWLEEQKIKWECPKCKGIIKFYQYTCSNCGYEKSCK